MSAEPERCNYAKIKTMSFIKGIIVIAVLTTWFAAGSFSYLHHQANQELPGNDSENSAPIAAQEKQELSLILVGDIMLDREVYRQTLDRGDFSYPYKNIDALLKNADLRIGNLEGPITSNKSVSIGQARTTFTFSPKAAPELARRFDAVSLANNHSHDFGQAGYEETQKILAENKIKFFGDYHNQANLSTIIEKNGFKIGLTGYHDLVNKNLDKVLAEISAWRERVDFLIVYPHWGVEYITDIQTQLQPIGHQFIDAGADLVIGTHPHVVEPIEIYKEKLIFYSLGNFIFDQYWSEETSIGLAVKLTLRREREKLRQKFAFSPLQIPRSSQTELANAKIKEKILTRLAQSIKEPKIKEKILKGEVEFFSSILR